MMHSQLELYLEDVRDRLRVLPFERRFVEYNEIRLHLLDAMAHEKMLGRTEDQAVSAVLAQFGPPGLLGATVIDVWRRERQLLIKDRVSFLHCASRSTIRYKPSDCLCFTIQ